MRSLYCRGTLRTSPYQDLQGNSVIAIGESFRYPAPDFRERRKPIPTLHPPAGKHHAPARICGPVRLERGRQWQVQSQSLPVNLWLRRHRWCTRWAHSASSAACSGCVVVATVRACAPGAGAGLGARGSLRRQCGPMPRARAAAVRKGLPHSAQLVGCGVEVVMSGPLCACAAGREHVDGVAILVDDRAGGICYVVRADLITQHAGDVITGSQAERSPDWMRCGPRLATSSTPRRAD